MSKNEDQPAQGFTEARLNAHFAEASAAMNSGRYEKAAGSLRLLLEIDPGRGDAWFNLGLALDAAGHPQQAIDAFRRAAELAPRDWTALARVGQILQRLERHAEAIEAYEAAACSM